MKVEFKYSEEEADNIRTFFFKPEKPIKYTAGQYVELSLDHPNPDNRGKKRWFTLSSSPEEELISITTKYAADKPSSFKKHLFKLSEGDVLDLNGPMGDFVLPKLIQIPLIFVAGGIGITPFHSILEWLSSVEEERPIKLLYAVKSEEEIIFQDTFTRANVYPTIIVGEASAAWGGERGHLSAEMILGLSDFTEDSLIYVSGPEPMVEKLEKDIKGAGVAKHQLVLDFFPNYPDF
jgi:ferredoxin-NADP reductase